MKLPQKQEEPKKKKGFLKRFMETSEKNYQSGTRPPPPPFDVIREVLCATVSNEKYLLHIHVENGTGVVKKKTLPSDTHKPLNSEMSRSENFKMDYSKGENLECEICGNSMIVQCHCGVTSCGDRDLNQHKCPNCGDISNPKEWGYASSLSGHRSGSGSRPQISNTSSVAGYLPKS